MTVVVEYNGQNVEFPDMETAQAFFASQGGAPSEAAPNTGAVGQLASGLNEGIAAMAGLPVDAASGLIEGLVQSGRGNQQYIGTGYSPETGMQVAENPDYQPFEIENPAGGSASLTAALDPLIADDAPDTTAERYLRSIGQDVGASAPFIASTLPRLGAQAGRYLLTEGLSSVGSGAGAQAAEDAGGGTTAQLIASLLGGSVAPGVSFATQPRPQGNTLGDVERAASEAYARRDGVTATLPPQQRAGLLQSVGAPVTPRTPLSARQTPRTASFLQTMGDPNVGGLPDAPTPQDLHDFRRAIQADVVGGTPERPPEVRTGQIMVDELDAYLRQIADDPATDPDLAQGINDTFRGNDLWRRAQAAEEIVGETGALTRATRRASTTGTGGNTINAMRQNIRAILDNPARRRDFTPEEIAAMERVVEGSSVENVARMVGRFAPSSGFLPAAVNVGAVATGAGVGGATGGAIAMMPAAIGYAGQQIGENMTRRNIDRVVETILNGRPLPSRALSDSDRAVLNALLASRTGLASSEAQMQ